jgi:hypothetical protein
VDGSHPEILSWYFRAVERSDLEVPGTCFTDDGRTYHDRAEILAWRRAAGPAYELIVEVLDWEQAEDGTYVVATDIASTGLG